VAGPLIPYIDAPEIDLKFLEYIPILSKYIDPRDPPSIKPFGTLVALGVYAGSVVAMQRARERKIDQKTMSDFVFWTVSIGFVLSHILDAVAYHPDTVMRDPLYLLKIWEGLSSYGGLIGAMIGSFAWSLHKKKPILEMCDITVSAFPISWVFGRMGCSVVHDHPGALSNAWFAVRYPAHTLQAGFDGRYDLGLIEMVLTIPLALACWLLWRKKPLRANGFYIGLTLIAYAPVRFFLDFLRAGPDDLVLGRGALDPRYAGLTPAQWVCFLATGLGIYFMRKTWKAPYVPSLAVMVPVEATPEAPAADDAPTDDAAAGDEQAPAKKKKKKKKKKTVAKATGPA
jgi:phosphatidylglycerol---prolipoprotein diacylglyceryl transferase